MRHVSVQQLSAFVDGALVGVSRELVTRHLAACAACRQRQAAWSGHDDILRRVLAWEPDERTFEEWSSRVELTITAERKGLPPPEFSEFHHPVIAPASEPDTARLDRAVQSAQMARRGVTPIPAPIADVVARPPSASEPIPAELVTPAPELASRPKSVEEPAPPPDPSPAPALREATPEPIAFAPPVPEPEPAPVPAPEPAPAPPVAQEVEPEPAPEPPVAQEPEPEPAPEPPVAQEPEQEPELAPEPEPATRSVVAEEPAPTSIPERTPPELVFLRAPEPEAAPPRDMGPIRPAREIAPPKPPVSASVRLRAYEQSRRLVGSTTVTPDSHAAKRARLRRLRIERPILAILSLILLVLLAGSPLVPEVIRIPLPDRWRWRLPRVEFVRKEKASPPVASADLTQLAARRAVEPVLVKPKPIPAPAAVESTATDPAILAADSIAAAEVKDRPAEGAYSIVTPRSSPPPRAKKALATPKKRPEPEPEPEVLAWPESPGTIIPTKVTTTVTTATEPPVPARTPVLGDTSPSPAPKPAESEEDWPLLCGTVLDSAGQAVEGARVVLPANALTVRTDHRGRFCVACPPGTQALRVEATGQQPFSRTVELSTGMLEITIDLKPAP